MQNNLSKGFYDHPDMFTSVRARAKSMRYKQNEPEWFVYGPQDVEEEVDLQEINVHSGGLQKSAHFVRRVYDEDEKENDLLANSLLKRQPGKWS